MFVNAVRRQGKQKTPPPHPAVGFIKFKNQPRTRPPRSTAAARSMAAGQDSSSRCQNISVMPAGQTVFALASLRRLP